jgi:hypothetical protein
MRARLLLLDRCADEASTVRDFRALGLGRSRLVRTRWRVGFGDWCYRLPMIHARSNATALDIARQSTVLLRRD